MNDTVKLSHLTSLIRQLLNDLPSKRDWLDPQLEAELRTAVHADTLERACLYGPIPWPWSSNTTKSLPQTRSRGSFLESLPGDTESQKG